MIPNIWKNEKCLKPPARPLQGYNIDNVGKM
jgi:hypothetical protein